MRRSTTMGTVRKQGEQGEQEDRSTMTLHSLGELTKIDLTLALDLPEIDLDEVGSLEELEAKGILIAQKRQEIRDQIPPRLIFVAKAASLSREAQRLARPKVVQFEEDIQRALYHENIAFRQEAWRTMFCFRFSQEVRSLAGVKELLLALVHEGRLKEVENEKDSLIRFFDAYYQAPEEASLEEPEKEDVVRAFRALYSRARDTEALTDLTWEEFLKGKPGTTMLVIPAEPVRDDTTGEIRFWKSGCQLRVKSEAKGKERMVSPVFAITGNVALREDIDRATAMGIWVLLSSLNRGNSPEPEDPKPEKVRLTKMLWLLLKRAEAAEDKKQQLRLQKDAMAASLVTVSAEDFFLRGAEGICPVVFSGPWEKRDEHRRFIGKLDNVFFFP